VLLASLAANGERAQVRCTIMPAFLVVLSPGILAQQAVEGKRPGFISGASSSGAALNFTYGFVEIHAQRVDGAETFSSPTTPTVSH